MDELAQYAKAQLERKYGNPVIFHGQVYDRRYNFEYVHCDHDHELPMHDITAADVPIRTATVVDCHQSFVVANGPLSRQYLIGQCPDCGRVHVFLRGEIHSE